MSYDQKSNFQDGGRRHPTFQKFQFLVTWLQSGLPLVYRISSKSHNFPLRYGDLTIFKMAAVRHLRFFKNCSFCHVALNVDMPFCFLIQNFAEIGQSVNELWPNKRFSDGGRRHLEFQKFQFLVTWLSSGSICDVVYQISSKSDDFWLTYGNLTIVQQGSHWASP